MSNRRKSGAGTIAGMSMLNMLIMLFSVLQAVVIARAFGTERTYDAYLVAFILPELIVFMATELINATLLPAITEALHKGGRSVARKLSASTLNLVFLAVVVLLVILELLAPQLISLMAPGFHAQDLALATILLRLLLPMMAISVLYKVALTFHHSVESFLLPNFGGLFPPIAITVCVLTLSPFWGIKAVVLGVTLGVTAQLLILIPLFARQGGISWRAGLALKDPRMRKMGKLAGLLLFGAAAERANLLIDRAVTSTLTAGKISALKYGFQMTAYAQALFSIPLNKVYYTHISQAVAGKDWEGARERFRSGLRLLSIFYLPCAVGLSLLALPLVRLLLERGSFTTLSSVWSAQALVVYSWSLLFLGIISLSTSLVYALKRMGIFTVIGLSMMALNLALDLALIRYFDHLGIALSTVAVNLAWSVALVAVLSRLLGRRLIGRAELTTLGRALLASAVMGAFLWFASPTGWRDYRYPGEVNPLLLLGLIFGGIIIYVLMLLILREGELLKITKKLRHKLTRT